MTTIIPFKVTDVSGAGFHLMIKIYISRKVANMVVDTGASKTIFDRTRITKFVSDKTFEKHNSYSTGIGTSKMKNELVTLKKVKIGELEIADYKTFLLDLSHVNQSYEQIGLKHIDGVIGSDLLVIYKAVIDYEKKCLKLKY